MNITFEEWWTELLVLAALKGFTPGAPEVWKLDNYDRGQSPEQAYKAEYEDFE
jgi:hypothetical protein